MRLERFSSVDAFLAAAGPFLRAREAEHCLILGVSAGLQAVPPGPDDDPPYLAVVREGRRVVAVGFQTPPWQMVLSEIDDPAAIELLAADRRGAVPAAVVGPAEHVGLFAGLVAEASGRSARVAIHERLFRLTELIPPRPVPGVMRAVEPSDAALLAEWLTAFYIEALGEDVPEAARMADRWLERRGGRTMFVWELGDRPVAMCGTSGPTPTGIRIAPVYTPPDLRGRGYATNLVATVTRIQLDRGRAQCFLYTDRSNPTANHIYQAIGYEPVRDVDQYVFEG